MLRDLNLRAVYRSECDNILEDFYIPALSNSVVYERAVGFFSATVLSHAAQGLSALISNGGQMRLIIGYEVSPEDEEAISKGYELKELSERIGVSMVRTFDQVSDTLFARRLEALAWLIAAGKLEVKVALKRKGMYHEKIGIFTDANGDKVIFQGSANETTYGLLPDFNFESINVFPSWKPEFKEHYQPYLSGFQSLWEDRVSNTRVIDFPRAVKEKLIRHVQHSPRVFSVEQEISLTRPDEVREEGLDYGMLPRVPKLYKGYDFKLHTHQLAALNSWKAASCSGILELATGAGKTITAIYGATKFFEASHRLFLVIAAPYQNLADQWVEELKHFNIIPVRCYVSTAQWQSKLNDAIARFNSGAQAFCCAVVVNATLSSPAFQACLSRVPGASLMWIGDECHHHGSDKLFQALPTAAKIRLGLSATPTHYMNDSANVNIVRYYGSTVYRYSLKQALKDGVLTPYKYHVIPVELNAEEADQYIELSKKIAQAMNFTSGTDKTTENARLNQLLLARARLLASAEGKMIALESLLANEKPSPLTLFYCGDGRVEDPDTGDEERQVEMVSVLLHGLGWKSARFTSYEPRGKREQLLDHFRLKLIDGLVAIRCLDEGIDVPACRRAYLLASSRNPRQQIQRRGRILRRAEGKDWAEIYDFLVMLPPVAVETSDYERILLVKELERVAEFASLALNHAEVVKRLLPVLVKYRLTHILSPSCEEDPPDGGDARSEVGLASGHGD
jgi:superfamily II DNA or RNA helicase